MLQVAAPPAIDILKNTGLWLPLINRHTESTLRYEMMAANRFKRSRHLVVFNLIVSRNYPYFTLVFQSYLRRAYNVPCRVQRYLYPVFHNFFAIRYRLQLY